MQHNLAAGKAATLIKLAFAAGVKLSAAFIAFGLTALVTRNMPNEEAGLFLLGFSLLAVLLPGRVMSLFGEGYEQAALLLAIMAVGQFINVATGSVG